jgi:acid phosphatase family membrane protein YuiD
MNSSVLAGVLDNGVLWWGLAACGVAQLSKLLIELLVETGGMPSSHSALLTGTTAALGWVQGFGEPLFGLAAVLCFVVLYDASGVRRAAGLTAARVNALASAPEPQPQTPTKPLKENLGHTRLEVLIGALIGPLVALPGLVLAGSPLHLAQGLGWFTPVG